MHTILRMWANDSPSCLHDQDRIYYDLGRNPLFDQRLIGWLNEFRGKARKTFHAPEEIHALDHMLHDMRVYKSREELSMMRRAAKGCHRSPRSVQ